MNAGAESRGHRVHLARPLIVLVFILQRLGDAAAIFATCAPGSPHPVLRGVAVAGLIWTSALLIGVWRRLRWARYLVTTFGWLYGFALSFLALMDWQQAAFDPTRALPFAAAALYLGANVILVRSRRVRHFTNH